MIGRRVIHPWTGRTGTVIRWEPHTSGMCDATVRHDDGTMCAYASRDLKPIDAQGLIDRSFSLPCRHATREAARLEAIEALEAILHKFITEDLHKRWMGCEHGKTFVGNSILQAIKELKANQ